MTAIGCGLGPNEDSRGGSDGHPRLYCVVPAGRETSAVARLREWFASAPGVEVLADRRLGDRRGCSDATPGPGSAGRVHARRSRDRRQRARLTARRPQLPSWAEETADEICFAPFAAGEREHFEHLYQAHYDFLHRYLRGALNGRSEADDLTHSVLMNAYLALSRGTEPIHPRAWLFAIARHELRRHFERQGQITVTEPDELERHRARHRAADPPGLGWLTHRPLIVQFDRLSDLERRVLVLAFVFDFANPEIARVVDTTVRTVEVTKSHALKKLRSGLDADGRYGSRAAYG